ncbi:MAG: hypothetical protein Q8K49_02090 [Brevundimonas sp.]|nr:hypothetical protein [Brevundimonas sp.]MDP1912095.1 hypothetical protein [Brevundimonas sp.]
MCLPIHQEAWKAVRSAAHILGHRFVLGGRGLPGEPHLVFPAHRVAIFVCPCDQFGHTCIRGSEGMALWPGQARARNRELEKFQSTLTGRGWRVELVWPCQVDPPDQLQSKLRAILPTPSPGRERTGSS